MTWEKFNEGLQFYEKTIRDNAQSVLMKKIDFTLLKQMYQFAFKKPLHDGCGNCYVDAVFELRQINNKIFTNMKDLEFQLKKNKVFKINGNFYTSQSIHLTNEICYEILKIYGKGAFEVLPQKAKQKIIEKITALTDTPVLVAESEKKSEVREKRPKPTAETVAEPVADFLPPPLEAAEADNMGISFQPEPEPEPEVGIVKVAEKKEPVKKSTTTKKTPAKTTTTTRRTYTRRNTTSK